MAGLQETLGELAFLADQLERARETNKLAAYRPYPKQYAFHAATARQRLFMAGNQLGKTFSGAAEVAMHATGLYPDWWPGRRFTGPTVGWVLGESGEFTRDNPQRLLLGRGDQHGTGALPAKHLRHTQRARGISGLMDFMEVEHVPTGKSSFIFLKFYEKGREKLQGETLDYAWLDEEPPIDVYGEIQTRLNVRMGPLWITFTPLKGMSDVVRMFLRPSEDDGGAEERAVIAMEIGDAVGGLWPEGTPWTGQPWKGHYSREQADAIVRAYPAHEREARARGIPTLGSGRIFPIAEGTIRFSASEDFPSGFPRYWPRGGAMDFADWDHPVAAVWGAWDRDSDTVWLYDAYRAAKRSIGDHAAAMLGRGRWMPMAWPHDGMKHSNRDGEAGEKIKDLYARHGLKMIREHAQYRDGSTSVEAGVADMLERFQSGRLRVADHLVDWWDEFRFYHRKDGLIVKERDDLMAATRYLIMSLRFFRLPGGGAEARPEVQSMSDYHVL